MPDIKKIQSQNHSYILKAIAQGKGLPSPKQIDALGKKQTSVQTILN